MELKPLILSLAHRTLELHRRSPLDSDLRPTFATLAALALPLLREGDPEVGGLYAAIALRFGGPRGLFPEFSRLETGNFLALHGHTLNLLRQLEQTFPDLEEPDRRTLLAEAYRAAADVCAPPPMDPDLRWEGDLLIGNGRLVSVRQEVYALVLPDSIRSIDPRAFFNCPDLTVLVLPPHLEEFSPRCVEVCPRLTHIFVPSRQGGRYFSQDGMLYDGDGLTLVCCPPGRQGSVTVPDWAEGIGPAAFAGCHLLEEILLSEDLTVIGDRAFLGCLSLEAIHIPDAVLTVGHRAFSCCPSLRRVVFNGTDTEFLDDTFDEDCDVAVLAMPASAAEITANTLGLLTDWDPDLLHL